MKFVIVSALFLALYGVASAGPYIEVGLSAMNGCLVDYDERTNSNGCSNNPFGLVAVGYKFEGFAVEAEHRSSLVEKDRGINALTVKYRWEFK